MIGQVRAHHARIGSTFVAAHEWAAAGAPHGALVTADEQTAGRGRMERAWHSPSGGLYTTIVLRSSLPAAHWPLVGFAAALAVVRAARGAVGAQCFVKWPNDVLLRGRKMAGVLLETGGMQERYLLLGCGINVGQSRADLDDEGLTAATSLAAETGVFVDREAVLHSYLHALQERLGELARDSDAFLRAYAGECVTLGRRVRVSDGSGEREGEALGIARDGALLFRPDGGPVQTLYAGDVSVRGLAGYADVPQ